MTFGSIPVVAKDTRQCQKPKPTVNLNWNPYIKKAARGSSVDLAPNRSAPFKPIMAASPLKIRPTNKQSAKTKKIQEAIQARKALYNRMFKANDEYDEESEYDSEY